jgi:hypothetical protein
MFVETAKKTRISSLGAISEPFLSLLKELIKGFCLAALLQTFDSYGVMKKAQAEPKINVLA